MALLLCIETATSVCSVALAGDGALLSLKETSDKYPHSAVITLFIAGVLESAGVEPHALDGIAVSKGPGSYTGLRIGVATAKGLCYSLDKPLIAISTLQSMAAGMRDIRDATGDDRTGLLFCPMIDARRMEVYSALFDETGKEVREALAEILDEKSFREYLQKQKVLFAGDGTGKCRALLEKNPNALFLEDFYPSAKSMCRLAEERFLSGEFEDLAYFEPFYLKDFIAGKPWVKGLR